MTQISKEITSNLPVLLNLHEMNEMLKDFMVNKGEELIYAFTDKKQNKCNQFFLQHIN